MKRYWLGVMVGIVPWVAFAIGQTWEIPYVATISLLGIFGFMFWAYAIFMTWDPEREWRRPQFGGNPHVVFIHEGSSDFSKALAVTQVPLLVIGVIALFYAVLHSAP